jgi:hypothetical protein
MLVVCAMQWVVTLKPTGIFEGEENGSQTELRALSTHKWKLHGKTPYPTIVGYGNFKKNQPWLGIVANVLSNF